MSELVTTTSQARATDKHAEKAVSSVYEFMTSVKEVTKRGGRTETFAAEKIQSSVEKALRAAGIKDKDMPRYLPRITGQVISRLQRKFDGHLTPHTADIRDAVATTIIDNNLIHVARAYLVFTTAEAKSSTERYGQGLLFSRYFTKDDVKPFDMLEWELRSAKITNEKGKIVFEQDGIETPKTWSQTAVNVVAQKYFRGKVGTPERENSMKQLISRVSVTMANWGRKDGYFQTAEDAQIFEDELTWILINQMAAFNSPVWFNVGVNPHPQCSACFINSVQDDMRSILHLCTTESMLFKQGSGTGSNLSNLRSSQEYLGGSNGKSSGPVSFMKGLDAFAGIVKSGGKTRRAAKMVILNIEHPDIVQFIECKVKEERKAWALVDAGYDSSMDGEAYGSIFFQNANNSVRVTDEFMQAVEKDGDWTTHEVTTGKPSLQYKARELMAKMAEAAWQCGDPGMQYDTTVNRWHTSKNTGRINASNPCSEYMFLDDTACNLSSLNLMKFRKSVNGVMEFDVESFTRASQIMITAMEIAVGNSSYPTPAIEQNSHDFRPLGIGFANLGALLMSRGLAYDSNEGRNLAAGITALLSGCTYEQSARIAEKVGAFEGFKVNREPCLEVMRMHRAESYKMLTVGLPTDLAEAANRSWDSVIELGEKHGLRNAQISVVAPTGTIAFIMDCDTTGIEPDIALVKYKWLVGGGMLKIVNGTVPEALVRLGYTESQCKDILEHIDKTDTIENAPHLLPEHVSVFDCAFKAKNGTRSIHYMGHLRMMAAVQPFISGAISKTVNMPNEATVAEVEHVYMEGWKMGLKAIAIYRDGSKRQQALTTSKEKDSAKANREVGGGQERSGEAAQVATVTLAPVAENVMAPRRRRMPEERRAITHKFVVGGHKGYITVGLYDDGTAGEVFITMAKEGSVISGLMDSFASSVSIGLQYGVPLQVLVNKFAHVRFEPSGFTSNPNIRIAKSIVDYIFRWLALKFLSPQEQLAVGVNNVSVGESPVTDLVPKVEEKPAMVAPVAQPDLFDANKDVRASLTSTFNNSADAPACDTCGSMMVRNAACYKCLNCGSTSGCS
ncbi:MAG: vitamin B12-dependent ribonucleotide reductase [Candidatus Uhrbacteria bacterium]|nr:vitamin B12-dependent ribonucleotide reductase [Candidatus Uhrbacteria bacterium]